MSTSTTVIANQLGHLLIARKLTLTTAESCTGGHIASTLCAAEDTPLYFGAGFVTFNDAAKEAVLGVHPLTLKNHTAVSQETVTEMAAGAITRTGAQVSIAVSGYAGPDGGEDGTPAGTVWFAWYLSPSDIVSECVHFDGDCEAVITQATAYALTGLLSRLAEPARA
ncbi:2-oxo-tetronate isomerase [Scandinavium sp. V105_16]|uniref:2-oxo-tetronate isomerase n=1 Tax=Scandinavium lactucae TaxID=3095028 RepID=A0AAJ2VVF6_9ENTR|nr:MULTISPECIES: 2-oxo-tetronate isomerase [unclassified Scandinavium]MDX6022097.1 2-oxo-tetronate isomerase [Scandinavium sp. V105_16]MDX6034061.1 2-oxo-tetronate isomerase [Scandinavium sp. V105_12]MDX6042096.1 2-oxo-tetronate isomerase [Scandinavium sp. V105_6]MDX6052097.1 2-oxo-tetronate isomerase [Scandinavium sp. V105_1]